MPAPTARTAGHAWSASSTTISTTSASTAAAEPRQRPLKSQSAGEPIPRAERSACQAPPGVTLGRSSEIDMGLLRALLHLDRLQFLVDALHQGLGEAGVVHLFAVLLAVVDDPGEELDQFPAGVAGLLLVQHRPGGAADRIRLLARSVYDAEAQVGRDVLERGGRGADALQIRQD